MGVSKVHYKLIQKLCLPVMQNILISTTVVLTAFIRGYADIAILLYLKKTISQHLQNI